MVFEKEEAPELNIKMKDKTEDPILKYENEKKINAYKQKKEEEHKLRI
jgi:hypothetical protein